MTALRFHATFPASPGPDPAAWHDRICNASVDTFEAFESFIVKFSDDTVSLMLACEYFERRLSISYQARSKTGRQSLYADADGTRDVIAKPGDVFMPTTSLLEIPQAAEVIREFVRSPSEPPSVVGWVDVKDLDWPEL